MTITGASGFSLTYGGTTSASITNSGVLTCASISATGTITPGGNAVLTADNMKITNALNYVSANTTAIAGPSAITNWSFSYKGNGDPLQISFTITAYSSTINTLHSASLCTAGTYVANNYFFFQNASTHLPMPPIIYVDNSGSTAANTWSLSIDSNMSVDQNDYCIVSAIELEISSIVTFLPKII